MKKVLTVSLTVMLIVGMSSFAHALTLSSVDGAWTNPISENSSFLNYFLLITDRSPKRTWRIVEQLRMPTVFPSLSKTATGFC